MIRDNELVVSPAAFSLRRSTKLYYNYFIAVYTIYNTGFRLKP